MEQNEEYLDYIRNEEEESLIEKILYEKMENDIIRLNLLFTILNK